MRWEFYNSTTSAPELREEDSVLHARRRPHQQWTRSICFNRARSSIEPYATHRHPRAPRLCALVYINLMLSKTKNLPAAKKSQLCQMYRRNFHRVNVEAAPSCEKLLWALTTDLFNLRFVDLSVCESTIAFSRVIAKLALDQQNHLIESLCDFLLLFPVDVVVGIKNWWSTEQLAAALVLNQTHQVSQP